jgi:CopG family nickel-responsive transcriptional regulator
VLRGKVSEIQHLADGLIGTKGVKHGKFVATTTGDDLV